MSEIEVNGYVRVPKGTTVYPTGDGVEAPSTREQVVKVARIFDVDVKSDNFYLLLPDEMRLRYFEASGGKRPIDPDILEFTDRLTKGDYRAVEWSTKWALIANLQPAEAPANAKKAEKAEKKPLTKQQQMVTGSVWRFTQDTELRYKVRNPAYATVRDDIENSLRQLPSHARTQNVEAKLNEMGVVDYLDEPWGPVKAGETFTVRGKLTSGFAGGQDVPMLFRGEKFTLPYSSLEPVIELVTER
ncbi:hypothetical protein JKG68_01360 [Microvirga aerilata]|uniref:Uncharacterized protein n=1 Tax=Microvirga aerilata TaxID=670292 RepID=A0A936Z627_9HYPH|nr:hypothetical protein [Microvirga aerilata]MBL0402611.1 hypothetical protein [Microvirga aerilata]